MIHDQTKFPFNSNFFLDRQAGLPIENEMDWDNHDGRSRPYQFTWTPSPNTNVGNNFIFSALRDGQLHAGHGIEPGDWIDLYKSSSVYPVKVISIENNHQIRLNLNGVNGPFTGFKKRINPAILNEDFAQWSFPPFGIELSGKAPMPTYSRSSNATRGIGVGQIETVAANVLRMDYNAVTGAYLGALFEGQKTGLTSSQGFSAAGAGSSVISTTIDAPDGSLTATRITGILAAAGDRGQSGVAPISPSTSYNTSPWARGEAGKSIRFYSKRVSGGALVTSPPIDVILTGQWQRVNLGPVTTGAESATWAIFIQNATPITTADTVDLWQGQIELGGLSSTILTPGSQATRQADTMVVNDMSWFNPAGGVFFAKVRVSPGSGQKARSVFQVGGGSNPITINSGSPGFPRGGVGVAGQAVDSIPFSESEWEYLAISYTIANGSYFCRKVGAGVIKTSANIGNYSGVMPSSMTIGANLDGHYAALNYLPGIYTAGQLADLLNQFAANNS